MAKRVLVVDFDPGTLDSTVTMLKGRGFEVVAASTLEQVEKALIPDGPDVALVEPALCGVDSYELCNLIHGSAAGSPSIILASHKMKGEALRFRASEVGAQLFFERPINDRTLVQAIAEAVSSAQSAPPSASPAAPPATTEASAPRSGLRAVPSSGRSDAPPAPRTPSSTPSSAPSSTSAPTPGPTSPPAATKGEGLGDSKTVELTSIGNTEFEGWLNDVFSGIEGPAEAAAPADPTPSMTPAAPPAKPAGPTTPAAQASPAPRPTPPSPPIPATPPAKQASAPPPAAKAAAPAKAPVEGPKIASSVPAEASPATATPVPIAARRRKAPVDDADFGAPGAKSRGPWPLAIGVAVLLALVAGGYFGWKQLAGDPSTPSTASDSGSGSGSVTATTTADDADVASMPAAREAARAAAADPIAPPAEAAAEPPAGKPAAASTPPEENKPVAKMEPTSAAKRSTDAPRPADSRTSLADARPDDSAAASARRDEPARPRNEPATQSAARNTAPVAVTAGDTGAAAADTDADAEAETEAANAAAAPAGAAPGGEPATDAPDPAAQVATPTAGPGADADAAAAEPVGEAGPADKTTTEATEPATTSAPAPGRVAPPAARMPDPFEFVRKAPPEPKIIEGGTATLNPPRLIAESRVNPEVPPAARRFGVSGTVVLQATVGVDGTVTAVEIVSEPNRKAGLGKAAARAVSQWRYTPATMNGERVESPVEVRITFAN